MNHLYQNIGENFWDYMKKEVHGLYGLKVFKSACDGFWTLSIVEYAIQEPC